MHDDELPRYEGRMAPDPTESMGPDEQIHIEQGVFVPNDPPGIYPVYNLAHYNGTLLSIHFHAEDWMTVEGSAVMVAPGIAITAAHVIEELIPQILARKLRIFCTGLTPSGSRLWKVRQITKVHNSDLMILAMQYASPLPPDRRFVQVIMSTQLPPIGEEVMIVGFRSSDVHVRAQDGVYFPVAENKMQYGIEIQIGVGEVTQHHLSGRGSMPAGPAFEVACSTSGGMSGGPAFDRSGRVVGILSASLNESDGRGPSQVSLLWPALVQSLAPAFLTRILPQNVRLLDLHPSLCGIEGRDAIRASEDPETGQIRLEVNLEAPED